MRSRKGGVEADKDAADCVQKPQGTYIDPSGDHKRSFYLNF